MPESTAGKITYLTLCALSLALLVFCIVVTVWSNSSDDGWISREMAKTFSWMFSSPFIGSAIVWTIVLLARQRSDT